MCVCKTRDAIELEAVCVCVCKTCDAIELEAVCVCARHVMQ